MKVKLRARGMGGSGRLVPTVGVVHNEDEFEIEDLLGTELIASSPHWLERVSASAAAPVVTPAPPAAGEGG